jgi:molecular chaperone DnaK (HSP70)
VPSSRYVIGVDLGTTNSALAFADTGVGEGEDVPLVPFAVPQVVQTGAVEDRLVMPSFLYLPGPNELPTGSLRLPWAPDRDFAVGEFARMHGSLIPTRLVASAKSWLCHPGIDRRAPVLPWKAPETARRVSPLEASTYYLKHLSESWDYRIAGDVPERRL